MNTKKIRAIAFTVIGAFCVICKFSLGKYNSQYVFNDLVSALGNILLMGGLVLLTIGITGIIDAQREERGNDPEV